MGSGKSTVVDVLASFGAATLSADEVARRESAPGSAGLADIVATFGPGVLRADGSLDRGRLASQVFSDPEALARLNAVTHPRIRTALRCEAERLEDQGAPVIVLEIPLLGPGEVASWGLDGVVVVTAREDVALSRLATRGLSLEEARARWAHQLSLEVLRGMADWVIDNSGSLEALRENVAQVWADLLKDTTGRDDSSR